MTASPVRPTAPPLPGPAHAEQLPDPVQAALDWWAATRSTPVTAADRDLVRGLLAAAAPAQRAAEDAAAARARALRVREADAAAFALVERAGGEHAREPHALSAAECEEWAERAHDVLVNVPLALALQGTAWGSPLLADRRYARARLGLALVHAPMPRR